MRIAWWVGVVVSILIRFLMQRDLSEKKQRTSSEYTTEKKQTKEYTAHFQDAAHNLQIEHQTFIQIKQALRKKIVGLDGFIHSVCVSLLIPWGHVLIEWVPWLAKTRTVAALSHVLDLDFKRIQCTPDMLPGDITWVDVFSSEKKTFEFVPGPLFTQMVLIDEINRTTPKVQSALLEAMGEKQITIGNKTYQLPEPFIVLATQNPLEQEWTYALPEAQIDRFLMKIHVWYPDLAQEQKMLSLVDQETEDLSRILGAKELLAYQDEVHAITISDALKSYIVRLVEATRTSEMLRYWASPRASLALLRVSKAIARLQWRNYVVHEDVQCMALQILRHRVVVTYDVLAKWHDVDDVLCEVLDGVGLS